MATHIHGHMHAIRVTYCRAAPVTATALLLALSAFVADCGDGSGPTTRVRTVEITPANPIVLVPATLQLTATARDDAGAIVNGGSVTWLSNDSSIVSVSPGGVLTGHARGVTSIRARIEGVQGTTSATVQMPAVNITIVPSADTVVTYDTAAFRLIATDMNGDTVPNPHVVWSSSNDSVATVDSSGVVITLEPGAVTIRAGIGLVVGTATLNIKPPRVASLEIRAANGGPPTTTTVPLRGTEQYFAFAYDIKGKLLLGRTFSWQSSNPSVLSIMPLGSGGYTGQVAALAGGTVSITVTSEGVVSPGVGISVLVLPALTFLAVGDFRSCAVGEDSAAYCWGANNYGELGDGTTTNRDGPALVTGGYKWAALTSGDFHTCGITETGAAYCWGRNDQGQLGTGTTDESHSPIAVTGGLTYQAIAAGSAYTCGVTTSHEAYCWGSNSQGQLGIGGMAPSPTPILVQGGHLFKSISTSRIELSFAVVTCGVTMAGDGYGWGTNSDGQLGTGDSASTSIPRLVGGSHQWSEISASTFHACGRDVAAAAYCWGANPYGAFGNGTTMSDPLPTPVDSAPYATVSAGYLFSCGVRSSGELLCFGTNESYQLGIDGPAQLESPTNPAPTLQFTEARAGRSHACALSSSGQAYCWGGIATGTDTLGSVHTPTKVIGQP